MNVLYRTIKRFVFMVLIVFFASTVTVHAQSVVAVGEGATKQAAINDAIRAAVEKALGAYVQADSKVSNGNLEYDRIISSSSGYVRDYTVLKEGHDPIEEAYKVKLQAEVDDVKLKSALDAFLNDTRFQKTFQKTSFDSRKVVVLYKRRSTEDLEYDSKGVQTVMDLIQDKLVGYGFRVFLQDQLSRIKDLASDGMINENDAIRVAQQEDGDAVVLVSIDAGKRRTSDGYYLIHSTLGMKAFDVTTGELFANVQDRGKTVSRGGEYGISDGVSRVAIKIGSAAAENLVKKIVERFSGARSKFITLIVRDVALDVQDRIEDLIMDLGWEYRIGRQAGSYLELEVFSESDPTSIRSEFRRQARRAGIALQSVGMKGSRIIFSSP
ncbi:MAG: hypothetical protein HQL54_06505 [Magnetococcales bacterium]|nr:hypothetical protein [Magnetococcales bacterium]